MKNRLIFLVILVMLLSGCNMNKNETISKVHAKVKVVCWEADLYDVWKSKPELINFELSTNEIFTIKDIPTYHITELKIKITNITTEFVEVLCLTRGVINSKIVQNDDEDRYFWNDKIYYGEERELFTDSDDAGTLFYIIFSKEPLDDGEN